MPAKLPKPRRKSPGWLPGRPRNPRQRFTLIFGQPQYGASSPICGDPLGSSRFFRLPGAGTLPASMHARDRSIWSATDRRSKKARCNCSHTPAFCQSRSRQLVIPLPHPISGGNISQGIPILSTNKITVNAARLSLRGRPPLGSGDFGEGAVR